jgi:hypothetical protein
MRRVLLIAVALLLTSQPVHAGIIAFCGDANNDGDISESDAAAALLAAAQLPSTCPIAVCDVNADDRVSVSDAVNILLNAAARPSIDACKDVTGGN